MRKLKLQVQVSIDGYMAGPNHEMDWMAFNWDDELGNFVNALTEPVDLILLGRNLASGFIETWAARAADPETADWAAHKFNDTAKVVFSKTLDQISGKNATLANGDLVETVHQLKQETGQDMIAYGGSQFVGSLIQHNLIDDYYLFVNPTAIGAGLPVFSQRTNLKLVDSKTFACGIIVLHYQPAIDTN
ncbi:dihydrofolate reductase family protein [Larkinella sp. VNQ87]|uniref:dihydrofolate reductase family protein n=1 Tax=Larkinella sp. VNQ87 TaxID=3400921 RepID=UPI003C117A32